uniref:Uncharacterized protein n=1 Tax=Lepeophtheirus salmonis TaxID=72036 RepID=A0A0K2TYB9_LEPSM
MPQEEIPYYLDHKTNTIRGLITSGTVLLIIFLVKMAKKLYKYRKNNLQKDNNVQPVSYNQGNVVIHGYNGSNVDNGFDNQAVIIEEEDKKK